MWLRAPARQTRPAVQRNEAGIIRRENQRGAIYLCGRTRHLSTFRYVLRCVRDVMVGEYGGFGKCASRIRWCQRSASFTNARMYIPCQQWIFNTTRGSALLILLRHGVRLDENRSPGATCGDRGAGVWVNAPLTQAGGGATGGKSQHNSVMVLALVGFRFSPWSQDRTL